MKNSLFKITIVAIMFAVHFNSLAQNFKGRVTYKSHKRMNLKLDSTKYDRKTIDKVTGFFTKQFQDDYILEFSVSQSLYSEQDKMNVNSTVKIGNNKLFKNFKSKTYTHKLEFLGKVFLIKDSIKTKPWIITNETKNIGKYTCTKAIYTYKKNDSDAEVVAWFTKELPINNGPGIYDGLPGLILQVDDDEYTILSTKIELHTEGKIKEPKGGKVIKQEEYDLFYEEKKKEGKDRAVSYLKGIESSRNKN